MCGAYDVFQWRYCVGSVNVGYKRVKEQKNSFQIARNRTTTWSSRKIILESEKQSTINNISWYKLRRSENINRKIWFSFSVFNHHGISQYHRFDSSHHHLVRLTILCTHHTGRWLETTWPQNVTWPGEITVVGVHGVADESSHVLCNVSEIVPL